MTETQAYVVDFVVGMAVTLGSIIALEGLGVGGTYLGVVAMIGLIATCFMVGVIGDHYERKKLEAKRRHKD